MKKQFLYPLLLLSFVLIIASCAAPPAPAPAPAPAPVDNRATDEKAIRDADTAWSNAASTLDGFVSYYADDVVLLPPNMPAANGKAAARAAVEPFYKMAGFALKFQPVKVEAAKSGDLGYVQGTYDLTANDPKGKPSTEHGKYLEVWKKQADGSWKCIVDMFSSDAPAPPPPTK